MESCTRQLTNISTGPEEEEYYLYIYYIIKQETVMQELFVPEVFFDLSNYAHSELFESVELVWDALVNIPKRLQSLNLGILQGNISKEAHLVNPELINIGIGTVVEPGAYIKGPCSIGSYCSIRHGAYLRGNVITGDHCIIGHATEVKNSIFLNNSQAAHFSYVGDSILGNKVNLGAGVKLANLLFNNQSIKIYLESQVADTGLRKLGAIIGDMAQIGCNSVTNPGTLMGKRSCVYPSVNVGGIILEDHSVKVANETITYPQKNYALP